MDPIPQQETTAEQNGPLLTRRQLLKVVGIIGLGFLTGCGTAVAQPAIPADGSAPTPNSGAVEGADGYYRVQPAAPESQLPPGGQTRNPPLGMVQATPNKDKFPDATSTPVSSQPTEAPTKPAEKESVGYEQRYADANYSIAITTGTMNRGQLPIHKWYPGEVKKASGEVLLTREQAEANQKEGILAYRYNLALNAGFNGDYAIFKQKIEAGEKIKGLILVKNPNVKSYQTDKIYIPQNIDDVGTLGIKTQLTNEFDDLGYIGAIDPPVSYTPVYQNGALVIKVFANPDSLLQKLGADVKYPGAVGTQINGLVEGALATTSANPDEVFKLNPQGKLDQNGTTKILNMSQATQFRQRYRPTFKPYGAYFAN